MQTQDSLDDATDRLVLTTMALGLVPALVIGVALFFVHPIVGLVAFLAVAAGWAFAVRSRAMSASSRVLGALGATPLVAGSQPRLENVLEGLCATGGVSDPAVYVIDSPGMNALAIADSDRGHLVLTTSLIEGLGRLETEGVLANLLGRVRDGSARYGTVVSSVFGSSGFADRKLAEGFGEQRAVYSDLAAIDMTRYPPGLISALARMDAAGTEVPGAPATTMHLWIAPPAPASGATESAVAESTMQPLSLRIAVLEEL